MNFLAHIYLSNNDQHVSIGNFIADGIKGKDYKNFPVGIQVGIRLHREIDTFTDAHPIVRQSTKRLHKNYGHYSGVIVDIFYDHFLAKNWNNYSTVRLEHFTTNFYDLLQANYSILPAKTQHLLPFMLAENWLYNYSKIEGIQNVLNGMNRRTKFISGMNNATNELTEYYTEFEQEFTAFFEELQLFASLKLSEISSQYNY